MYPRTEYELTEAQIKKLLGAAKPVPCMLIGGHASASPQENVNNIWWELGKELGFDWDTVRPVPGKGQRFFTAIPSETELQKEARIKKEKEAKRQEEIQALKEKISVDQKRLQLLENEAKS